MSTAGGCGKGGNARRLVHGLAEEPHGLGPHGKFDTSGIEQVVHVGIGDGSDGGGQGGQAGSGKESLDGGLHLDTLSNRY